MEDLPPAPVPDPEPAAVEPGEEEFFDLAQALAERIAEGLVAIGGDLSVPTLLAAYREGMFPWFTPEEPVLWYSPDPRFILPLEDFHLSRSLGRTLARGVFELRADTAVAEVIAGCAGQARGEENSVWLSPAMEQAYLDLAAEGYVHSIEAWRGSQLVGGLYGLSLGGAFFGESMFHTERDASKAALAGLVRALKAWGMTLLDCQVATEHLARFGAREVPRSQFLVQLRRALTQPTRRGSWTQGFGELQAATPANLGQAQNEGGPATTGPSK